MNAVILAAGSLSPSIAAVFGQTSVGLLPVNGQPVLARSLNYLEELGLRRVIVGLKKGDRRAQRLLALAGRNGSRKVEAVHVSGTRGPGETLLRCLEAAGEAAPCLIVLGDTLFRFDDPSLLGGQESFVLVHEVRDAKRWCFASADSNGRMSRLIDKPDVLPDNPLALVGVYCLHDCAPAVEALRSLERESDAPLEMRHALEPYVAEGSLRAVPVAEWYDCGNLDFLTSSRRRLLAPREFNTFEIDERRGTVTKRSRHREKFVHEVLYLRAIPDDLAVYFPRVVAMNIDPADTFLTLEYYAYETLSEMWVFHEHGASFWMRVLDGLLEIVRDMGRYTIDLRPDAVFAFYWGKTESRLRMLAGQNARCAHWLGVEELEINGCRMPGWRCLRDETETAVKEIAKHARGQIVHGDLCFANILYNPIHSVYKLIDPRGTFADSGLFGDPVYDAAKIAHSLRGGYDFIIHDMYGLQADDAAVRLEFECPDGHEAAITHFEQTWGAMFGSRAIAVVEALLFLSMGALHSDYPQRQEAMLLRGLELLHAGLGREI